MGRAGGVDQRFRGDAADVEARSAEPVGFDENRVEAELAGADRGDIAARAAADDENLAAKLVHLASSKARVGCHPRESGVQAPPLESSSHAAQALLDTRFDGYGTFHRHSSINSMAGASISVRKRWMKVAASWPSTTR